MSKVIALAKQKGDTGKTTTGSVNVFSYWMRILTNNGLALAAISLSPNFAGNPRPAVRMVCVYYENGMFYVTADARKNKMLRSEVIAIGDNYNDINMIEFAGLGIAMGNAPDAVKQCADDITLSNDEDGVAKAIKKYLL